MKRLLLLKKGVTMIELLVVLVVISILSTISVGVYTNHVQRARFAKARAEIRVMETAVVSYQIDVGSLPPSGDGTLTPGTGITSGDSDASGFLQAALRASFSGNLRAPSDGRWQGPYLDWDYNRLAYRDGTGNWISLSATNGGSGVNQAEISFLDPWNQAYVFTSSEDYSDSSFDAAQLPTSSPFFATETYYNPTTFQIMSKGPNGTTGSGGDFGTEPDDVTNYLTSNL